MGKYKVEIKQKALAELKIHKYAGNKASNKKIEAIFKELEEDPYHGVGNPEKLKYNLAGYWSRRINQKDRIVYRVEENIVTVVVISAIGHYSDK